MDRGRDAEDEAEAEAVEVVAEEDHAENDEPSAVVAVVAEGVVEDDDEEHDHDHDDEDDGHESGPEEEEEGAREPEKKRPKKEGGADASGGDGPKESASGGDERPAPSKKKKKSKKKAPVLPGHTAVKGLTIPFRNIKRTMKNDKDIATVQNEAAIVATCAAELFIKKLADESHKFAKKHGRNTIRYEDVAEARASNRTLDFLDTLLP